MLWTSQSIDLYRFSKKNKKAYIVSTHGMVDPWVMDHKKKLFWNLFEKRFLNAASCIQALTKTEYLQLRELGITAPIAIIPNGIEHRPYPENYNPNRPLVFIGRIDPKKGLDVLLESYASIKDQVPELHIYGWGEANYVEKMKAFSIELGLNPKQVFKGAIHGEDKTKTLHSSSAFILPSHSEGLPMAVLEAWAHGVPVLMSSACNLPEGFEYNAAIQIEVNKEALAKAILRFYKKDLSTVEELRTNAKELILQKFDWVQIKEDLISLYKWCLKEEEIPPFIMLK